jgi:hypothetical protein
MPAAPVAPVLVLAPPVPGVTALPPVVPALPPLPPVVPALPALVPPLPAPPVVSFFSAFEQAATPNAHNHPTSTTRGFMSTPAMMSQTEPRDRRIDGSLRPRIDVDFVS